MNRYLVTLSFDDEYEIEAESEEEAVDMALEYAIRVGEWEHDVELVEPLDDDEEDEDF